MTYQLSLSPEGHGFEIEGAFISGKSDSAGIFNATITAMDEDGNEAQDNFIIDVKADAPVEVVTANADQSMRVGAPIEYDASQSGKTFIDPEGDLLTYSVSFSPAGQGLISEGAIISGTPAMEGVIAVTVTATDDGGNAAEDSFEITISRRDASEIFVKQSTDIIDIFVKGSVTESRQYLRYRFEHHNKPASRAIGWGWRGLHEVTLLNDQTFLIGDRLINGGENFMAIRETGKSDFMGGTNHGDQIDSSFKMLVDGEEKPIDGNSSYFGSSVELKQVSTIYEVDNPVQTPTAISMTNFEIGFGENTLQNRIEFTRPAELSAALVTMLSVDRYANAGAKNLLITSTGEWSPNFEPVDISFFGHLSPRKSANEIKVYSPNGYHFEVEVTSGWDKAVSRSEINDGRTNNKLYFSPIGFYPSAGPGLQVPAGHIIEVEAKYRLDTTN